MSLYTTPKKILNPRKLVRNANFGLKVICVIFGDEKVKNLCSSIGVKLPGVLCAYKEDKGTA